ncbi:MAG: pirin family protein [Notoacmeibacter sp.]|nr:pirin family protein [Notoacmeibacter sp.]MCC0033013.1 pirin family protein [Brucellaceae bacterium]
MSFFPADDPVPGDAASTDAIDLVVLPSLKDVGGFDVRRALPTARRRMVGPFIFFDRMGPAILRPGMAMDVRPHPHIGISTVTYLFDGKIRHRDSLGTEMVIAPGDVNLMTAGRGIVHSERTPEELRGAPMSVSGLQTWLALPDGQEEIDPHFATTLAANLPETEGEGIRLRLVMGSLHGMTSPVHQHHETLYADLRLEPGAVLPLDAETEERALYVLSGKLEIGGQSFPADRLIVLKPGAPVTVRTPRGAHAMLFGGASIGSKRYIWWNFVSSSRERIEQAREEWKTGRFDIVPGDEEEFTPLPR